MGSWMNSFGSSDQTRSAPELTGSENSIFGAMAQGSFDPYLQPGPGVVLTTILFLYALRYFSKMLRLEKRLAESTKRERKRKQNENQAESA
jgi:hypothetical protein